MAIEVTGFEFRAHGQAPQRVPSSSIVATLIDRLEDVGDEAIRRFLRLWRLHVDQLLRSRGTAELRAMMPVHTGRLRRSIHLYLRGYEIRLRGEFYVWLNPRARVALERYARTGLQRLVRDAAELAVSSL